MQHFFLFILHLFCDNCVILIFGIDIGIDNCDAMVLFDGENHMPVSLNVSFVVVR